MFALFVGSLVGAALVPVLHLGTVLVMAPRELAAQWQAGDVVFLALEFGVAWCVFAIGLFAVGAPAWWALHRARVRSRVAAVTLGFVATFLVSLILSSAPLNFGDSTSSFGDSGGETISNGRLTTYGWMSAIYGSSQTAVIGAIVALVVWWIAYRRR